MYNEGTIFIHYIIYTAEILLLSFISSFISSLGMRFKVIAPDRNIISATLYSILMPSCLCSSFPIILASKNDFLRIYIAILSPLLSPLIIGLSLSLLGIQFTLLKFIISIGFALLTAFFLARYNMAKTSSNISCFSPSKNIIKDTLMLFKISLPPIVTAIVISIAISILLGINYIGKLALFPSTQIIAILLAGIGKFCAGQDIIILSSIKALSPHLGFFLGFSLMAEGLCLSMLPIYKRIYKIKGIVLYIFSIIILSMISFMTFT